MRLDLPLLKDVIESHSVPVPSLLPAALSLRRLEAGRKKALRCRDALSWAHIPARLYPLEQPIPRHPSHGIGEALVDPQQLPRLCRAQALGMLLEQRDNA